MSDNTKMTRFSVAAPKQVEGGAETGQDATSIKYDITATEHSQMGIAGLLLIGEENAVPLRHIRQMVDLPGREIRRQIQMEREHHIPILSGRNGYYLAGTEQEKKRFVRGMKSRAAEIVKVAEAVEAAEIGGE